MQKRTIAALIALAFALGVAVSEFVYRTEICRDAIGRFCGRGRLLVLVNQCGIYEVDVKREIDADRYAAGQDSNLSIDPSTKRAFLARLIAAENLRQVSRNESISEVDLQRQFDLFGFELGDEKLWTKRMHDSGISKNFLRTWLRDNLRGRKWVEHHIPNMGTVGENACRKFYAAHPEYFAQPLRLRASHLFLVSPPETPEETVQAKQQLIDMLAKRISNGEEFRLLVSEASEDEANKLNGGDLGYFSSWRIPPDFFSTVSQLHIGELSKPFRSRLGFHLVQLLEIKPPHELTFETARLEIVALLTNQRLQVAIEALATQMSGSSTLRDGWF